MYHSNACLCSVICDKRSTYNFLSLQIVLVGYPNFRISLKKWGWNWLQVKNFFELNVTNSCYCIALILVMLTAIRFGGCLDAGFWSAKTIKLFSRTSSLSKNSSTINPSLRYQRWSHSFFSAAFAACELSEDSIFSCFRSIAGAVVGNWDENHDLR